MSDVSVPYTVTIGRTLLDTETTVYFEQEGGSGGNSRVKAIYGDDMPSISLPTRAGYDFKGFFWQPNGQGTKYYNADGSSARTCDFRFEGTLYAHWEVAKATITLDDQGGTGGSGSVQATQGSAMPALSSLPTRDGYNFQGYYTQPNGQGTKYYNADGTSAANSTFTSATTLYAYWTEKTWIDYADTSWDVAGVGDSESNPYIIDTPQKLAGIAKNVNEGVSTYSGKFFKQTTNIKLAGTPWVPIKTFQGVYDGGGYSISGMVLDQSNTYSYSGLFGYVGGSNSQLKNINIKLSNLKSSSEYLGSIVGKVYMSKGIINCTSDATLVGANGSAKVGGIVGYLQYSNLYDSVFSGDINCSGSTSTVGGIAGVFEAFPPNDVFISNCNVVGATLQSGGGTGGVVGIIANSGGTIEKCNVTAKIKAKFMAGGIISATRDAYTSMVYIKNCNVVMDLDTENADNTGGIIGYLVSNSSLQSINNCSVTAICNLDISPFCTSIGGVINSNYSNINNKRVYTSGDFSDWGLVEGMNDGLPMQRALYYMAEMSEATSEDVIARLQELGFTESAA